MIKERIPTKLVNSPFGYYRPEYNQTQKDTHGQD